MWTADRLRAVCLDQPAAEETFPFSAELSVFKVAGKVFALCALDETPLRISLKCVPEVAVKLRIEYPAITAGYHLNKQHWNTVLIDGSVPDDLVREMIEDSYDLVRAKLPRNVRNTLGDVAPGK
ncbi:MmcQ/YjbR family DNA-binding protein [Actinospica sp. MGRD01-02]|uniref:MmcQ/YjbR family DNA-binding protein n=1 Tax=Actinospica acidithermotolerans TaxID=2828514 RepID=A0A941EFX6_9ACTN|nr:MmcQ/YjbR family DNA-binding protein [Actinospica acidithermotolerans]MBR7830731.1 MmcQ/YjbR family DNA-binding protein [Actinospica acidithermotolerans]